MSASLKQRVVGFQTADLPSGLVQNLRLLEIDPRGRPARWTGIDQRGYTTAQATMNAIYLHTVHSTKADTPELPYLI